MVRTRAFSFGLLAAVIAGVATFAASPEPQAVSQQLPERQLPVFRGDAHFVRVDAYPTNKDGSPIKGLTAADFELTEDGVAQTIDSAQFIEYERWTPGAERPDPRDQRESFRLAADPSYRVVVVYVDRLSRHNAYFVRQPLIDLLSREVGPRDLFGILLPFHEASDLVLGRFTPSMQAQLGQFLQILNHNDPWSMDPVEQQLLKCFGLGGGGLLQRWRVDNTYRDLEGLIRILGTIRDERKSLVYVTEQMPGVEMRRGRSGLPPATGGTRPTPPASNRPLPGAGGLSAGTFAPDYNSAGACQMLASSIPETTYVRFEALIDLARRMNVAVSTVNPAGLTMTTNWANGYLRQLSEETGGIAVVNTNAVKEGLTRIKNDMPAYYVLGYYTSNTKWDGRMRRLRVKLKKTGQTVRARYEYQAPTAEDVAAMRAAAAAPSRPPGPTPEEAALNVLARVRPDAALPVQGALQGQTLSVAVEIPALAVAEWRSGGHVEVTATDAQGREVSGRTDLAPGARGAAVRLLVGPGASGPWRVKARVTHADRAIEDHARLESAAPSIFGDPVLYRAQPQPTAPFRAVADPQFWRTERLRAEWLLPRPSAPYTFKVRLLQTTGRALSYEPPVTTEETDDGLRLRLDLPMSPFAAADYLLEVTATYDGGESRTLQAFRVLR